MKSLRIIITCLTLLVGSVVSFTSNAKIRLFSAMDIEIIRDEQSSSSSGNGSIGSGGVSGGGSSSSTGSGAVLGVLFECSFAFADCETYDQKYVPVDGDPITL